MIKQASATLRKGSRRAAHTPRVGEMRFRQTLSKRELILFSLFATVLILGVLTMGSPVSQAPVAELQRRAIFLFVTGILGTLLFSMRVDSTEWTRADRVIATAAIALPAYALVQIIPLPVQLLRLISPARAQLVAALTPVTGIHRFASISIVPGATFTHLLLICAYAILFFASWTFASRNPDNAWLIVAPVVVAAALEAVLGLLQFSGAGAQAAVRGTYEIRNHFAGIMEMALPFPAVYAFAALRDSAPRGYMEGRTVAASVTGGSIAILLIAAALLSLSRGGLAAILISGLVTAAVATNWSLPLWKKMTTAVILTLVTAVALFFITPISLVARFSDHSTAGRISVWSEVPGVLKEYFLMGCGLGGFESAFLKFKVVEKMFVVDYAHNDYLQFLAELGIVGFVIGLILMVSIFRRAIHVADHSSDLRWIGLACVGSMAAIAVHSASDFNLYVPANAAVLAWICGIAAGAQSRSRKFAVSPVHMHDADDLA